MGLFNSREIDTADSCEDKVTRTKEGCVDNIQLQSEACSESCAKKTGPSACDDPEPGGVGSDSSVSCIAGNDNAKEVVEGSTETNLQEEDCFLSTTEVTSNTVAKGLDGILSPILTPILHEDSAEDTVTRGDCIMLENDLIGCGTEEGRHNASDSTEQEKEKVMCSAAEDTTMRHDNVPYDVGRYFDQPTPPYTMQDSNSLSGHMFMDAALSGDVDVIDYQAMQYNAMHYLSTSQDPTRTACDGSGTAPNYDYEIPEASSRKRKHNTASTGRDETRCEEYLMDNVHRESELVGECTKNELIGETKTKKKTKHEHKHKRNKKHK